MKITKKQLRRIIKEERARLEKQRANRRPLKESVTDMRHYEEQTDVISYDIAELFYEDMVGMYDEEPEMFGDRPRAAWEQEVAAAQAKLEQMVQQAIIKAVQGVEQGLHDGQFSKGM